MKAGFDARRSQLVAARVTDLQREHVGTACSDDIVSDLVCCFVEARHLSRAEQHRVIQTIIRGGVEATANLDNQTSCGGYWKSPPVGRR